MFPHSGPSTHKWSRWGALWWCLAGLMTQRLGKLPVKLSVLCAISVEFDVLLAISRFDKFPVPIDRVYITDVTCSTSSVKQIKVFWNCSDKQAPHADVHRLGNSLFVLSWGQRLALTSPEDFDFYIFNWEPEEESNWNFVHRFWRKWCQRMMMTVSEPFHMRWVPEAALFDCTIDKV